MRARRNKIWIESYEDDVVFALGDFNDIHGTVTAEVFEDYEGFFAIITSCKVLLNGKSIEWLHRLTIDRKEELENGLAKKFRDIEYDY